MKKVSVQDESRQPLLLDIKKLKEEAFPLPVNGGVQAKPSNLTSNRQSLFSAQRDRHSNQSCQTQFSASNMGVWGHLWTQLQSPEAGAEVSPLETAFPPTGQWCS